MFASKALARVVSALSLVAALWAAQAWTPERAEAQVVFGISGEGGGFVGHAQGVMGGVALRLGVAPTESFAIYLQSHGLIGTLTGGIHEGTATGVLWNTAMAELRAGAVHLAIGPSIDFAWGCAAQESCYAGTPALGLDGRIAVQVGHFLLSVDAHPTFLDQGVVLGVVGGLGWEL